jgi:hypothetical protein
MGVGVTWLPQVVAAGTAGTWEGVDRGERALIPRPVPSDGSFCSPSLFFFSQQNVPGAKFTQGQTMP